MENRYMSQSSLSNEAFQIIVVPEKPAGISRSQSSLSNEAFQIAGFSNQYLYKKSVSQSSLSNEAFQITPRKKGLI